MPNCRQRIQYYEFKKTEASSGSQICSNGKYGVQIENVVSQISCGLEYSPKEIVSLHARKINILF